MADFVKIQLIQGADDAGNGGTVVDAPSAKMPDGHIALILGSVDYLYGPYREPPGGADPEKESARNYSYRLRQYTSEVVKAAAVKQAKAQAEGTAKASADAAIGAVEVIE